MNKDKFRRIVDKYHGNRYIKYFTCWNQLLAFMFGQLSNRESLRDLIVAFEAYHSKCYHLGMGTTRCRMSNYITKLLQKSEMRKVIVIELSYKGFS